ncbi:MAG TPA: hypothetical protein EYP55_05565, partial [Anaerolineae bacterium]|nr:hypothetical protein [Anaerolineae bacterium]
MSEMVPLEEERSWLVIAVIIVLVGALVLGLLGVWAYMSWGRPQAVQPTPTMAPPTETPMAVALATATPPPPTFTPTALPTATPKPTATPTPLPPTATPKPTATPTPL